MTYKTVPFEHDGKQYEVRIASDGRTMHFRAFMNNQCANGYSYTIDLQDNPAPFEKNGEFNPSLYQHTIDQVISDVKNGVWESYLKAVGETSP